MAERRSSAVAGSGRGGPEAAGAVAASMREAGPSVV